ncbi:Neuroendocrine protein 7B2 [Halotydeus destructor]|nr:Neuroendocrine protein 7B2 [Halotydeus destructor]
MAGNLNIATYILWSSTIAVISATSGDLPDSLLGGLMKWYADDDAVQQAIADLEDKQSPQLYRVAKEFSGPFQHRMDDILLSREPSLRDQEYLEHSSLFGHQYVQGGAGEGYQHLKPDGSVKNIQVIKTDAALPAYCNPPNPCPPGYTAEDGCLEDFVNTAAFSRDHQASQECMCDSEHMFDCPGSADDNELDTLARSLSNREFTDKQLNSFVDSLIAEKQTGDGPASGHLGDNDHKVVAKKFFAKKQNGAGHSHGLFKRSTLRFQPNKNMKMKSNPYLQGERLPVIAKKSPQTSGRHL